MADLFLRRTTGFLLFVIFLLCLGVVALLALLLSDSPDTTLPNDVVSEGAKPVKIQLQEEAKTEPWQLQYRIPPTTVPLHYDLYLHPDLETGSFSGRVAIKVSVTSPIAYLVIHVKDLNITRTKLRTMEENSMVELMDYFEYKPNQFWVLRPRNKLARGNYSIELEFDGSLEDRIVGFYKSVYTNAAGEKRSIATSKFQPTDARGAFPCFDEPSFRSTFTVTLVRPSQGYIALSNMPEQSQTVNAPRRGLTEVMFQKSVPMVTYLACFIVCDFEHVEIRTQHNKLFRVYATPEQVSRSNYAKDIGVDILNYFEKYFEVDYPLPKQDMIAIPDFVSGAMEHWGLITYREVNLLYDPQGSSSYNKQRVATVVSHELAHMWFGNLVTLSWWDDLWLNEGFASYIEYKGVAQYEEDWDMLSQFLVLDLQPVLRLDAQLSSHPIIQPVAHPDQISEIFDSISYSKGASVLRMLDNLMGEHLFRKGVSNFLRHFEFGNAVTSDLWRHFEETSSMDLNISSIMDTWTKQMGYPVLNVRKVAPNKLEVRQQRFLQEPTAVSADDSPYGYQWDVPVTIRTAPFSSQLHWLYRDMPRLFLTVPSGASMVKLNSDQYGYYRVNYDQAMWDDLIALLKEDHEMLSPSDRSNLLDDAFSLAAADQLSYTVPFRLASYLAKETHYVPWKTVASHISNLGRLLQTHRAYPLFRQYVLRLVQDHARRVGWEDTGNHLQRMMRPLLLSLACKSGSKDCLTTAQEKLQQWLRSTDTLLPPNLRTMVYKYGMQSADYGDWEMMLQRYSTEKNAQEKSKLLTGLTSTTTHWIMHRYLDVSRNTSLVRSQDYLTGLIYAGRNPAATAIVWSFIKSEWQFLVGRYTVSNRYLGRTVKALVSLFTTEQQLQDAERWFAAEPDAGSGARARLQALEEARKSISWLARHGDTLDQWLQDNVQ